MKGTINREELKLVPPPNESFLQGATLPPFQCVATPIAKNVLDTILPGLHSIDCADTTVGGLLSVADLKSLIHRYECDRMGKALSLILHVHVQHGCNKLRKKLPVYFADTTLFQRYMDQYKEWYIKRVVQRVAVRNAENERTTHLEYKFTAPTYHHLETKTGQRSISAPYSMTTLKQRRMIQHM